MLRQSNRSSTALNLQESALSIVEGVLHLTFYKNSEVTSSIHDAAHAHRGTVFTAVRVLMSSGVVHKKSVA